MVKRPLLVPAGEGLFFRDIVFVRFDPDSLLFRGEKVKLHQVESGSSSDEPPADARAARKDICQLR